MVRRRSAPTARRPSAPISTAHHLVGGYGVRDTPVPIPNTVVKPHCADGTAGAARWESTSPPTPYRKPPLASRDRGFSRFRKPPGPGELRSGQAFRKPAERCATRRTRANAPLCNQAQRSEEGGGHERGLPHLPAPALSRRGQGDPRRHPGIPARRQRGHSRPSQPRPPPRPRRPCAQSRWPAAR